MKELTQPLKLVPDTNLVSEFQKEYTLKAKLTAQRGLILWAVDFSQMKVKRVEIKSIPVLEVNGGVSKQHKAPYDPNAIYVWAMNEYNALRKVERDYEQFITRTKEKENR